MVNIQEMVTHFSDTAAVLNLAKGILTEPLGPLTSGRYNALYGPEEILNLVMLMCSGNMYSENAVNGPNGAQLEQGAGRRVPTPQWLNYRLRTCPADKMRQICRSMTDVTVRAGLNAGLLTGRLVFGMDKHNQPCHDDPPNESETVRTPRERGLRMPAASLRCKRWGPKLR